MDDSEAYPLNAPGPFFVARDQCIACGAPQAEAPELITFDDAADHCYFKRQPQSPEELDHAIRAVIVACCDAVKYRGDDPTVLARFPILVAQMRKENESRTASDSSEDSAAV